MYQLMPCRKLFCWFLIFTFIYMLLSVTYTQSQDRQCFEADTYDYLNTDTYRLYYFSYHSEEEAYELWYVDNLGFHNTQYTVYDIGITTRLSPDRSKILVVYGENETLNVEIVYLHNLTVERWVLPPETDVYRSPATAVWVDDQHIGFEAVSQQQLVIQNITNQEYYTIPYPEPVDFDPSGNADILLFSPNFSFVMYPVADTDAQRIHQRIRTYRLVDVQATQTIASFTGYNPTWGINSDHITYWTEDGELGVVRTDGQIQTFEVYAEDTELISASISSIGYAVATGFFVPRPPVPSAAILLIDMASGETHDICTYGAVEYTEVGRFANQLVLWTPDGDQFVYVMQVRRLYYIFVVNIAEGGGSGILPVYGSRPILVGWVSQQIS